MKIGRIILDYASKDCMEACYKAFEAAKGEVISQVFKRARFNSNFAEMIKT